jgi:hypothetical protein
MASVSQSTAANTKIDRPVFTPGSKGKKLCNRKSSKISAAKINMLRCWVLFSVCEGGKLSVCSKDILNFLVLFLWQAI